MSSGRLKAIRIAVEIDYRVIAFSKYTCAYSAALNATYLKWTREVRVYFA